MKEIDHEEVYAYAACGLNRAQVCEKLKVTTSEFNKQSLKNPALIDYLNRGTAEYMSGFKTRIMSSIEPAFVEALKKALLKGEMKAIEVAAKVLGFEQQSNVTNNSILLPPMKFDISKLAPEEQQRKLVEARNAKEALNAADAEILDVS